MPPPRGSADASAQEQQMSFRRAKSTQGNTDADGAREALRLAFQSADIDRSGMIGAPVRATPPKAPNTNFPQAHHACTNFPQAHQFLRLALVCSGRAHAAQWIFRLASSAGRHSPHATCLIPSRCGSPFPQMAPDRQGGVGKGDQRPAPGATAGSRQR